MQTGSSPWARGTLITHSRDDSIRRFIPVGTGNTTVKVMEGKLFTVHPRGHGEHKCSSITRIRINGSSPWARGTRCTIDGELFKVRFIPVGTGNTLIIDS